MSRKSVVFMVVCLVCLSVLAQPAWCGNKLDKELTARVAALEARATAAEAQVASLSLALAALEPRVTALEPLGQEVVGLNSRVVALEARPVAAPPWMAETSTSQMSPWGGAQVYYPLEIECALPSQVLLLATFHCEDTSWAGSVYVQLYLDGQLVGGVMDGIAVPGIGVRVTKPVPTTLSAGHHLAEMFIINSTLLSDAHLIALVIPSATP